LPLAKVRFDTEWMRVPRVVGALWLPRDVVINVRAVSRFARRAIRFDSADGAYDGVLLWVIDIDRTLRMLGSFGWPVEGFPTVSLGVQCPRCGFRSGGDDRFCRRCGASL